MEDVSIENMLASLVLLKNLDRTEAEEAIDLDEWAVSKSQKPFGQYYGFLR